jgi:hypothetical protein
MLMGGFVPDGDDQWRIKYSLDRVQLTCGLRDEVCRVECWTHSKVSGSIGLWCASIGGAVLEFATFRLLA